MNEEKLREAMRLMMCNGRMHKKLFGFKLKDIGIHRSAHVILLSVEQSGGVPSQKALAENLGITPAAVTGMLKKLEKSGYIERKCAEDSRYNVVKVTERGAKILEETKKAFREVDRSLFEGFSDSEIESYIRCQEKIKANIEREISKREECAK